MIEDVKKLLRLWGPLAAFASSIWYISSIFHTIDGRIDHLEDKLNTILVQVQSSSDVRDARSEARTAVIEEKIKNCGCQKKS